MDSSRLNQILPFKTSALWKGFGLGVVAVVLLLAVAIPSLRSARKASFESRSVAYLRSSLAGDSGGLADVVHADAPKIIRKGDLALQVANCAETQKKIEALAAVEAGFVESSTLEESSAEIHLRVPSERFEPVRDKLRQAG